MFYYIILFNDITYYNSTINYGKYLILLIDYMQHSYIEKHCVLICK